MLFRECHLQQHIDNLKKENFNIKLRVHFLEERLAQLAPDQIDAALKQNITLKIEVQQRGMEIKKLKKLVLSLERELERLQHAGGGSNRNRERELEEKLEEREVELRELRRRKSGYADDGHIRETEARNAELEDELDNVKGLLQENMEEIDRLREIIEQHGHDSGHESMNSEGRRELRRQLEEVRAINEELDAELEDRLRLLGEREDEKEELLDQIDDLRLQLEEFERKREAESIERSESRAQVLEQREEKEVVVENLNSMRDKYAALVIELQQREDELELKGKEIEELVTEHQRIVEVVEDEWKGEVEEARTQVEELRDVSGFIHPQYLLDSHLVLGSGRKGDGV
jgi:chromosome segregation ATPase